MKKYMYLGLLGIVLTLGVQGCSRSYADASPERRAARAMETRQEIDSLVMNQNFKFVPDEVTLYNGTRRTIRRYEYASVLPTQFLVRMTGTQVTGHFQRDTSIESIEQEADRWLITILFNYHTGTETFYYVIDRNTGRATVRVESNRNNRHRTYVGWIQTN